MEDIGHSVSNETGVGFLSPCSELTTIPRRLQHFATQSPEKEAVVFVSENGERDAVTFKNLHTNSTKVARSLVRLGVSRYESVAINLPTCKEWIYTALGAMMAGARPVVATFKYADGSDMIALIDKLKTCSCLVFSPGENNKNWNVLSPFFNRYSSDGHVSSQEMTSLRYAICCDSTHTFSKVKPFADLLQDVDECVELPDVLANDLAILFPTSGSTGTAKVVAHTHTSILHFCNVDIGPAFTKDDIYFCDEHFGWINGFPIALCMGQTRIAVSDHNVPKDRPSFYVDVILREKVTIFAGSPDSILDIKLKKDALGEDLPLKTFFTGGQPINKHVISSLESTCKYIVVIYGSTEFNVATCNVLSSAEKFNENDCGFALPGVKVKVVDSEGKTVPRNTTGEIYVKSTSIFRGYYNDPDKSKEVFADEDWYKTDDLGRLTDEGSLIVEGRKSNIINSSGIKVVPEVMENMLSKCPGVESIAVVPIPDDVMYQLICACVKILPGSSVNEEMLRKFCDDAFNDNVFTVRPKYYMFMESFPTTPTGKVQRTELVKLAKERFNK